MAKAKEIVYTGEVFDAQTALALGIVNKVVPPDELMKEARGLAEKLVSKSAAALTAARYTAPGRSVPLKPQTAFGRNGSISIVSDP